MVSVSEAWFSPTERKDPILHRANHSGTKFKKQKLPLNQNVKKVKSCLSETQEKVNKNIFLNLSWEINTEVIFRLGLKT